MKITATLFVFFAGTMVSTAAYTLSVTNQSIFGDPSLPVYDASNNPLMSGSLAVGFFGSDAVVTNNAADFATLLGSFTEYGTTTAFNAIVPGLVDVVQPAAWTLPVPQNSTDPQVGENIYVLIGNMATIAGSTEFAVWKSDTLFGTGDALGLGSAAVVFETGTGSLLVGDDTGSKLLGGLITYSNNITLVSVVPEPSTTFLGTFSGLAFVARRRR